MVYMEMMLCVIILNIVPLTQFKVIHDLRKDVDKMRELQIELFAYSKQLRKLQLEFSAYRNQSIETVRLLQQEYSSYRTESVKSERQLEERIIQLEAELESFRNQSGKKQISYQCITRF